MRRHDYFHHDHHFVRREAINRQGNDRVTSCHLGIRRHFRSSLKGFDLVKHVKDMPGQVFGRIALGGYQDRHIVPPASSVHLV